VGALYVQIIAGYNLVAADSNGSSDPYVRGRLGSRTHRTQVICDSLNPKWNATPFIFEVPSLDARLRLECLDSDFFKDAPLGDLELTVAEASLDPESSIIRRSLSNVAHGELELMLFYVPGKAHGELEFMLFYVPGKGSSQESDVSPPVTPAPPADMSADTSTAASVDPSSLPEGSPVTSPVTKAGWTPWGPAAPSEAASTNVEPRQQRSSSNPFASDSPQKGGYLAVPQKIRRRKEDI